MLRITWEHSTVKALQVVRKFSIIVLESSYITPTHLIEIEQQNEKKKKKATTKIQQNNAKVITITTKIQHNYF
jgi:hypothetical protein